MDGGDARQIRSAEIVLPCADLAASLAFYTGRLGFQVRSIHPADDPTVAVIAGHGLRIRLQRDVEASPVVLRLACDDPDAVGAGAKELVAPDGTRIVLVAAAAPLVVPPVQPSLVISRAGDSPWRTGRAGMRYRDLIPGRQGGRFVASHIAIAEGGPVADYVHFHRVRFQLIYCHRGWVSVVYQDQGPPFTLGAGDCVLQPPGIRHRVLACSPGLEVFEVSCPAEHETVADPDCTLPSGSCVPDRDFAGQRFVRHQAATAPWGTWPGAGFEARDLGLAAAAGGACRARVVRAASAAARAQLEHALDLVLLVVLRGAVTLTTSARGVERLAAGDAAAIPAGTPAALGAATADLELLEVTSPSAP